MKIVFMGTPKFAVGALEALINSEHKVAIVFTRPDKPNGRGNKIAFSPVKECAFEHDLTVAQPLTLKNNKDAVEILEIIKPDCIVVSAYGAILPEAVLKIPKYGCLNIHASLLPKYRGAAPINRCIMDGETKTGVTIMKMDKGLDTGDMLLREEVEISEDMNASELTDVLAEKGAKLILKALSQIETLKGEKQDDSKSSYASMLEKSELKIDFTKSAREVYNFIRGLADSPCAYAMLGDKRLKVYKSILGEHAGGISVNCADGAITLTEVQLEGGKRMKTEEFLKGYKNVIEIS